MLASARLFPKFVSEHAASYHELRKPGTSVRLGSRMGDGDEDCAHYSLDRGTDCERALRAGQAVAGVDRARVFRVRR